ncbi:MAG: DUF4321 domain-containing protein [Candidatus Omnitrophica bacterium]|nr:DUF4321 domain-containing protein [Candidatus Omnitrophota bacterium]MCM8777251.1 DUF4321 domain-containing protein [Candidatus Omnitrophota bacterium]
MKIFYILLIIFLSALIGTAVGELLLLFIPQQGIFYEVLSSSIKPYWNVENLDLIVLSLKCGISFNFNVFTLLGIIAGSVFSLRRI